MKLLTVVGTRPELIRLSRIIPLLDKYCDHILVHTGQNYDPNLKDIFFEQLSIREPDYSENCSGASQFESIAKILTSVERIIQIEKPDKFLVLGDTNSSLSAIVAKRYGIKVYHMESGNRCYDDNVPEEVNRRIIDHSSDVLMPYTDRSRQNLLSEGIHQSKIFVTGNPIKEVIDYALPIHPMGFYPKCHKDYFLVTLHRSENVDNPDVLTSLLDSLGWVFAKYKIPIKISTHPHTRKKLDQLLQYLKIDLTGLEFCEPFGFKEFLLLEKGAFCVLTDSGTVGEECCLFHVPNVILRTTTERPEVIECGGTIIAGFKSDDILRGVNIATNSVCNWKRPVEYDVDNVSEIVAKIILGSYP